MTAMLTFTRVFILAHGRPPVGIKYIYQPFISVLIPNQNRAAKKIYGAISNLIF